MGKIAGGESEKYAAGLDCVSSLLAATLTSGNFKKALECVDHDDELSSVTTAEKFSQWDFRVKVLERALRANEKVLGDFQNIVRQTERIKATLDKLEKFCAQSRSLLHDYHVRIDPILNESKGLREQASACQANQEFLDALLRHFSLSDDTVHTTCSNLHTSTHTSDEFFTLLETLYKLRNDCHVLLAWDQCQLGTSILEKSTKQLNFMQQTLLDVTVYLVKMINWDSVDDQPSSKFLSQAIPVLSGCPEHFDALMEVISEIRGKYISNSLLLILSDQSTMGIQGNGGLAYITSNDTTSPTNNNTHSKRDSARYTSDILAWMHATAVTEQELLTSVLMGNFELPPKMLNQSNHEHIPRVKSFQGGAVITGLIDKILTGTSKMLRQRLEQIILCNQDAAQTLQITSYYSLFIETFSKLVGKSCQFIKVLQTLHDMSKLHLQTLIEGQISFLSNESLKVPEKLSIPTSHQYIFTLIGTMVHMIDTIQDQTTNHYTWIRSTIKNTVTMYTAAWSLMYREFPDPQRSILALNCLDHLHKTLRSHSHSFPELLPHFSHPLADLLAAAHLRSSGLSPLLPAARDPSRSRDAVVQTCASPTSRAAPRPVLLPVTRLERALQCGDLVMMGEKFRKFIRLRHFEAFPEGKLLLNQQIRNNIIDMAKRLFYQHFKSIESLINDLDSYMASELSIQSSTSLVEQIFSVTSDNLHNLMFENDDSTL